MRFRGEDAPRRERIKRFKASLEKAKTVVDLPPSEGLSWPDGLREAVQQSAVGLVEVCEFFQSEMKGSIESIERLGRMVGELEAALQAAADAHELEKAALMAELDVGKALAESLKRESKLWKKNTADARKENLDLRRLIHQDLQTFNKLDEYDPMWRIKIGEEEEEDHPDPDDMSFFDGIVNAGGLGE